MKKWLIMGASFVIIIATISLGIYYQMIRTPMVSEEQEAIAIAYSETDLDVVSDIEFYHGTESYQVIEGTDKQGEEIVVFIRSDGEKVLTIKAKDGLTKEQVEQFALKELSPKELLSIRLGIEQELPVYEITYLDNDDRYAYYYLTFKDGTFVKRYSLRNEK